MTPQETEQLRQLEALLTLAQNARPVDQARIDDVTKQIAAFKAVHPQDAPKAAEPDPAVIAAELKNLEAQLKTAQEARPVDQAHIDDLTKQVADFKKAHPPVAAKPDPIMAELKQLEDKLKAAWDAHPQRAIDKIVKEIADFKAAHHLH